jgi:hypothetical protein
MTEVQGRGTGALNIERIYSTNVPAVESGGPLPRAGLRDTGLRHQREPHGDAGSQGEPGRQLLGSPTR